MLIVNLKGIDSEAFQKAYPEKVSIVPPEKFTERGMIGYIEIIKEELSRCEVVFITYAEDLLLCLDALNIEYTVILPDIGDDRIGLSKEDYNKYFEMAQEHDVISLEIGECLETVLGVLLGWEEVSHEANTQNELAVTEDTAEQPVTINKNKLTLQELIEQDIDITEADVRELKSTTNKFKVAMLLQAKSRLNTVLKLCGVLDKLYDELVNRIDESIKTTDTASLMYTTDYIAKALSETNQFIMSLITNEKIQNFFIIENNNVINISDDRVDINKRERIRKAAEIVIDNIDYFTSGDFNKITNPNEAIEVVAEDTAQN
jgi:hypothetical protein